MKATGGIMILGLAVLVLAGVVVANSLGFLQITPTETPPPPSPDVPIVCDSTTSPTVTLSTPDFYGGAAVTTQNIIRQIGFTSTTDVAGAGTFAADPGDEYEIMFGIDSDDDDAEPFGPVRSYIVPCAETPNFEVKVIDDSVATALITRANDPNDGNLITSSDPIDLDAGQIRTIPIEWEGVFEEDFGNRFCEDDEGFSNVVVVRYNTTQYDDVFPQDTAGTKLPTAPVNPNLLLSASSGFVDVAYFLPVLRSNVFEAFKLVVDTDDTINPTGGDNTTVLTDFNVSNITLYLYDVNWFIDNDVTPSAWTCGIYDEDNVEVGATAADQLDILVEVDPA